ncbi:MAG: type IV pili methyl-accepting chemotaxis transducer N-terminal domain-containing protein [Burkholderiaceae bacterium]|nr:type IV pili methyl-accepting chemotaxis transducer N-terminal domain-containing protein [Burkholderiaceae bacterium]
MQARHSLAFKLTASGVACLVLALASIALTLWVTWQLEGGAAAVNEAGRMRMMTYRMALDISSGQRSGLAQQAAALDATLDLLHSGDPSRPLFVPSGDESRRELARVLQQWQTLRDDWLGRSAPVRPGQVEAMVERIDQFVTVIEQRLSYWTAVLRGFQLALIALAIGSALMLLYASHLMVLDPLRRLGQALSAIRGGDFGTRVKVRADDEFGELAVGFNAMAARLQSQYAELEDKVRDKTAKIEAQRQRLGALYEVSAFIAEAENLDDMARGFVSKIRRIARADAVALRWSDATNKRYLLLAHEGLPASFKNEEQCVPSGDCHCGQSAATARTRVIAIRAEPGPHGLCGRAGFETLLTVPVSLHHHIHGEIDLFFRSPQAVSQEDQSLVELLASHLAGGMEGLRAVAAEKEAAVASERSLLAQELHDSIAQSLAFLKIQVQLLRGALRKGDAPATERSLAEIETGVLESYGDVRELLMHFRTRVSLEDIEPALRTTLQKFEHQTGLSTELQTEGHGVPLPPDVQIQVLHVIQEALSNVRKHAGATHVLLRVQQAPRWRFEVIDDGVGFDPGPDPGESHVGMRIMRERALRIGAEVSILSTPGAGTRVLISVAQNIGQEEPQDHEQTLATAGR